VKLTWAVYL